ncbi:MAG: transcriptional regulator [Arcobacter sp.]|nr:transcriptional regulator [Arcobacter sp.]
MNTDELYEDLHPNVIKQVCKDLNLTYKKLSYELGYKPDTINKAASTGKVSDQLSKAIELYLENLRLKEQLKDFDVIKQTLQNVIV